MKNLAALLSLGSLLTLASCGGGGGGGGGGSTTQLLTSPTITSSQFVSELNSVDSTYRTQIMLKENQTYRSQLAGQDDWFVIYDAKFSEYKAVSLQYIRSIAYYDYYTNNKKVASEFRRTEEADVKYGNMNGDYYGNDYETVDYTSSGYYLGRNSGYYYEDEQETTDVSLMAKEAEQKKFLEKAAKVSFVYNVSLESSLSLVTLGEKVEKMLNRGYGELTKEDQLAISSDLEKFAGVNYQDIQKATESNEGKEEVIQKIANKIGTSAQNLEQSILPNLLGVKL